jgi:hypothetical protein
LPQSQSLAPDFGPQERPSYPDPSFLDVLSFIDVLFPARAERPRSPTLMLRQVAGTGRGNWNRD